MGYETTWMDTFVFFQVKCWEITSMGTRKGEVHSWGPVDRSAKDFHLEPYLTASLDLWYLLQKNMQKL